MCLSFHCSTLSCQLRLLPVLTSPRVNASYVRGHIIQCISPSSKGPHLTAPEYRIQRTRARKNLGALERPPFNAHFSFDVCDVVASGRKREIRRLPSRIGTGLPPFFDVLLCSGAVCLDMPLLCSASSVL